MLVLGGWVRCLWIVCGSEAVKEREIIFMRGNQKVMTDIKKKKERNRNRNVLFRNTNMSAKRKLKKMLVPLRRKILWWALKYRLRR